MFSDKWNTSRGCVCKENRSEKNAAAKDITEATTLFAVRNAPIIPHIPRQAETKGLAHAIPHTKPTIPACKKPFTTA